MNALPFMNQVCFLQLHLTNPREDFSKAGVPDTFNVCLRQRTLVKRAGQEPQDVRELGPTRGHQSTSWQARTQICVVEFSDQQKSEI